MHGIHGSVARRLEALARRLGAAPLPETDAETNRRLELCRYALRGETPGDLDDGERLTFTKIKASVPIFRELISDGIIDQFGQPQGGDDYPDPMLGEIVDDHEDDQGDGEPTWRA